MDQAPLHMAQDERTRLVITNRGGQLLAQVLRQWPPVSPTNPNPPWVELGEASKLGAPTLITPAER